MTESAPDAANRRAHRDDILLLDDFSDDRAAGKVVGTASPGGAIRHGCDLERQIAIDHGALRFQPLVRPGWARQGIAYGPYRREPGLALLVSITNGHNTSQGSPIPEDIFRRIYRWLRGPGIDPWPGRLVAWARAPRKKATLRRFWWWASSTKLTYRSKNLDENLAIGWFTAKTPADPVNDGCGIIVHAAEGENGELWARVGERCLSAFKRLKNLRVYYAVVVRERGAIYYAAADRNAHGLAAFPMMRPIAIDAFNKDETLFAGIHQSALGQIGFRVDTRVHGVCIGRMHDAGGHVDGVPDTSPGAGNPWRVLRCGENAAETLSIIDPGQASGLIHAVVEPENASGACGLAWRVKDRDNFWLLKLSSEGCWLVKIEAGSQTVVARDTGHRLHPSTAHSIQILDWDDQASFYLDGETLFDASFNVSTNIDATAVGLWTSGRDQSRWRAFEAHPREVPLPFVEHFEAPWNRFGDTMLLADRFKGEGAELDGRSLETGEGRWERTLGSGRIDVDGAGGAWVRASVTTPNPGRTFYSLPWRKPDFADLEVSILPPGDRRGQDQKSRAGIVFWQDPDNYLCVTTWLDDVYEGASMSVFIKRFGFEELYDAVWTNVADKIVWGRQFQLRTTFDGDRFAVFIDDEPVMHRSLTDIYPGDPPLRVARVGLAVNWEWGDDTGSVFNSFATRC